MELNPINFYKTANNWILSLKLFFFYRGPLSTILVISHLYLKSWLRTSDNDVDIYIYVFLNLNLKQHWKPFPMYSVSNLILKPFKLLYQSAYEWRAWDAKNIPWYVFSFFIIFV